MTRSIERSGGSLARSIERSDRSLTRPIERSSGSYLALAGAVVLMFVSVDREHLRGLQTDGQTLDR